MWSEWLARTLKLRPGESAATTRHMSKPLIARLDVVREETLHPAAPAASRTRRPLAVQ